MNANVSVIVPVYNAEKTLERCVQSILNQKCISFELLLINDGSTDNSGMLCDKLAENNPRIKVIHQTNKGAAAARNTGLEHASGDYIMFCDSDDVVSPCWVSRLMDYVSYDTMVVGAACSETEELGESHDLPIDARIALSEYYAFQRVGIAGFLWNSIFSAEIIRQNHLRFREHRDEGDYNEDLLFVLQYVKHMKQIVYTGYTDYFYDTHEGSLSRKYTYLYFKKYEEKFQLWHDFLTECGDAADLIHLAEKSVYHFLVSMDHEVSAAMQDRNFRQHYAVFSNIVQADAVQKCVRYSDCNNENPRVISLIKKKALCRLWLLLYLSKLKGTRTK